MNRDKFNKRKKNNKPIGFPMKIFNRTFFEPPVPKK